MGWVEKDSEGNVAVHAPAATPRGPKPAKAYLDNCLVGGLVQDDLDPAESKGIYDLIDRAKDGGIELVSSTVTKEEIERLPAERRAPHRAVYAFLTELPTVEESELMPRVIRAAGSGPVGPLLLAKHDLGTLSSILPDWDDARHVFQALKNECNYFVTVDHKTILAHTSKVEAEFPIRLLKPSQVALLTARAS